MSTTTYEWHLTDGKRDGIGVYTGNLVSSLKKIDGVGVRQFYYPPSISSAISPSASTESIQFCMPYYVSGALSHALNLTDLNNQLIKSKVDLYHCTDYKIPKLKGVPVVATLHDAIPLSNPEWASGRFRQLKNKIMKNSVRWADHVITISDFVVDDVVQYWNVPEEKVSVVHNGVDDFWFQKQSEYLIDNVKLKYNIDKPYVLFVGTFQPRKNINAIIDAFISLPELFRKELKLVLVGKGGWRSEDLVVRVNKLVVNDECVRIENASDSDVRCLYQGAKVFLFPSLYEGFGLPVLEAFASRVPVITSKDTALEEVAGDAAILVDPDSVEEISHELQKMLNTDEVSIAEIKNKGFNRALMFSWEKAAEKIHGIYKNLI